MIEVSRGETPKKVWLQKFLEGSWSQLPRIFTALPFSVRWDLRCEYGAPIGVLVGKSFDGWVENVIRSAKEKSIPAREIDAIIARAEIIGIVLWEFLKYKGLVWLDDRRDQWEVDEGVVNLVIMIEMLKHFVPWRYGVDPNQVEVRVFKDGLEELERLVGKR